jgi:hypothetical protein
MRRRSPLHSWAVVRSDDWAMRGNSSDWNLRQDQTNLFSSYPLSLRLQRQNISKRMPEDSGQGREETCWQVLRTAASADGLHVRCRCIQTRPRTGHRFKPSFGKLGFDAPIRCSSWTVRSLKSCNRPKSRPSIERGRVSTRHNVPTQLPSGRISGHPA